MQRILIIFQQLQKNKRKNINFKWFIIGYGGDEQLIHDKIKESGMEDEVIILGKKQIHIHISKM